jgi:hypothetical protein
MTKTQKRLIQRAYNSGFARSSIEFGYKGPRHYGTREKKALYDLYKQGLVVVVDVQHMTVPAYVGFSTHATACTYSLTPACFMVIS